LNKQVFYTAAELTPKRKALKMKTIIKKRLTCTIQSRTLYGLARAIAFMDATTKKMVQMHADLRREIAELQRKADSVKLTLDSLGFRSKDFDNSWDRSPTEIKYAEDKTFANMSLVDTCKRILHDYPHGIFTKNQIEYLAATGGYPFATDDSTNSVDVTMRRLAKDGFCEVHRRKGPAGNIYCLTVSHFVDVIAGEKLSLPRVALEKMKVTLDEALKERRDKDAASTKDKRKQ
jgi:hypothetical protein